MTGSDDKLLASLCAVIGAHSELTSAVEKPHLKSFLSQSRKVSVPVLHVYVVEKNALIKLINTDTCQELRPLYQRTVRPII